MKPGGRSASHPWHRAPLLIGHRGSRGVATENTLEAIEAAAELGVDGVEVDVRATADGTLVLLHDPTLARTAGERRAIARIRDAELDRVRQAGGERVAKLDDALSLAAEHDLVVNVELKHDAPGRFGAARRLAATLRRRSAPPAVVSSFDPFALAALRRCAPGLRTALLIAAERPLTGILASPLGVQAVHPAHTSIDAASVRREKRLGRLVLAWTVNDPREAARLLSLGIDGIITDHPEALRPLFSHERSNRPP